MILHAPAQLGVHAFHVQPFLAVRTERGLYLLAVGDARHKISIDSFEFATGSRSTIVDLQRPWWYGMALSPDGNLLFSPVNSAGSNLMLSDEGDSSWSTSTSWRGAPAAYRG
jgi:hypothetical protein